MPQLILIFLLLHSHARPFPSIHACMHPVMNSFIHLSSPCIVQSCANFTVPKRMNFLDLRPQCSPACKAATAGGTCRIGNLAGFEASACFSWATFCCCGWLTRTASQVSEPVAVPSLAGHGGNVEVKLSVVPPEPPALEDTSLPPSSSCKQKLPESH